MPIKFECPWCGQRIKVKSKLAGKRARCLSCNRSLYVPPQGEEVGRRDVEGELAGRRIAHYEFMELVGRGGMGTVYKARNLSIDSTVAIKVFSYRVIEEEPSIGQGFVREARLTTGIHHPNLLAVHFAGRITVSEEEDFYVIEMEHADGGTVRDLLAQGEPFDPMRATEIIRDAAQGLSVAHEKNIIHRDIKPGNILLMKDGVVKVGDFGLAKLQYGEDEFARPGFVVGTPYYMSPEQGLGKPLDGRSDIYSLGVTYYELVTGRKPFEAEGAVNVLRQHAREPLLPPSESNPKCPESVCNVIMKMMAKSPRDRYQDCTELIEDLDRVLAGKEVVAVEAVQPFEVSDADIFRTVARFSISGGALSEESLASLLEKASDLGLTHREAEAIINEEARTLRQEDVERVRADIPSTVAARPGLISRKRVAAAVGLLARVILVLAISLGLLYGGVKLYRSAIGRVEKKETEKRLQDTRDRTSALLEKAAAFERLGDWSKAAEAYRQSTSIAPSDRAREHLHAVQQAETAGRLVSERKWQEAEKVYEQIENVTYAKNLVCDRLGFVRDMQKYEHTYHEAKSLEKEGKLKQAGERFEEASQLAAKLRIKTDAKERMNAIRAAQLQMEKQLKEVTQLLGTCLKHEKYYAAFAVCRYMSAPTQRPEITDLVQSKEKEIVGFIKAYPSEFPSLRATQATTYYTVRLKDGKTIQAPSVEHLTNGIKIRVNENGKTITRFIMLDQVASVKKTVLDATEFNKARSERLFIEAVRATGTKKQFEALSLIGQLMWNFPDARLLKDEKAQRDLSRKASGRALTVQGVLEEGIAFSGTMCPTCLGVGQTTCPKCWGAVQLNVSCRPCSGTGRKGICKYCRGTGMKQGACSVCRGTRYKACARCKGRGCKLCGFGGKIRCTACNSTGMGVTKRTCPACRGKGTLKDGEMCPACKGKGRPICVKCDATGKDICPACNGTGEAMTKCRTCNGEGAVTCPSCRGRGKP